MKALLVTGILAKDMVERYAKRHDTEARVIALKVPVAALLTPHYIARELREHDIRGFDIILLPGLIRGDVSSVEEALRIPTFKGPRYAADLPPVLDMLDQVVLSKKTPADDLLRDELNFRASEELRSLGKDRDTLLKSPGNTIVGELAVGKDFPLRIMAEIVDAPLLSDEEIQERARHYVRLGAEIIDVGMVTDELRPDDAERAVKAVKSAVHVPVSIDTLDPEEARMAVSAGADLILSIDAGNVEKMAAFASKVAAVVIPTNHREGFFPKTAKERVEMLEEIIRGAKQLGLGNIFGDLILDPVGNPGIVESLVAFHEFATRNPNVPLLLGVGNVTEMMDADSVGANALLAGMASELGASILLTTERSDKAKGSISELVVASKMMFLSKRRGCVPKDLGLDLLILKDKRKREEPYSHALETEAQVIRAEERRRAPLDPKGCFKIAIDRENEAVVALHFMKGDKPLTVIKGHSAAEVYGKIAELGLATRLDHAAYLGHELGKAEIALIIGKEYIQDSPLFKRRRELGRP